MVKNRKPAAIQGFAKSQTRFSDGKTTKWQGVKTQNEGELKEEKNMWERKVESKDSYGNNRKRGQELDSLKKSSDCLREQSDKAGR